MDHDTRGPEGVLIIQAKRMKLKLPLIFILILPFLSINAQEYYLPLNNDINAFYDPELNKLDNRFHTSVRPYRLSELNTSINTDSLIQKKMYFNAATNTSLLYRKLKREHLFQINSEDFHCTISPLFNFEFGKDRVTDSSTYLNGRGFSVNGSIGKNFSFSSSFYENQGTFVPYLNSNIRQNSVVPGQGYVRDFYKGFDYGMATGYISYTPSKYFNFQFGNDKNFIGDGYRSLLLSDNSFNYPFLKITTTIWKFKYVNLFAQMDDIRNPVYHAAGHHYKKKYGSFHYLSYNVTKRLNIGLFENVMWSGTDTLGNRGFEVAYLNPVIFYRPVEFSKGSPDNVNLGLNWKYKINNWNALYGQVILDEFKLKEVKSGDGWYANKHGIQFGLKSFNLFTIKDLNFQTEFNAVRPYMYSHVDPISNYAHYNQALAHPLGSNFKESVSFLRYRYKSFYTVVKFLFAVHGADTAGQNFGNDLYLSYLTKHHEYGNYIGQGLKKILTYQDFRVGYIVNPKTNLNIEVGISSRSEKDIYYTRQTNFIYFGIRTSLTNFYYDF